ncbi:MAG: hypothetical protein GXP03_15295 [Alphaproteobacteria bacterium]|nr:hypothetical protein [Alphaproteobacteria bacterium]
MNRQSIVPTNRKLIAAALGAAVLFGMTSTSAFAQSQCLAGVAGFKAGQKGIYVKHAPMGPHSVVVQATNTAGYSSTGDATYFNVLKIKSDNFQVQHKRTVDGVPIALDVGIPLNWIACTR